jgi:hypothetical protein
LIHVVPRIISLAFVGLAIVATAACTKTSNGTPASATTSTAIDSATTSASKPPAARPRSIKLDGKKACDLLPQSAWPGFKIEKPGEETTDKTYNSAECFYDTNVGAFDLVLVATEGLEAWTSGTRTGKATEAAPVLGFPAISITNDRLKDTCRVAVDVSAGQYLLATAQITPGSESKVAPKCDLARQLAELTTQSLLAQA